MDSTMHRKAHSVQRAVMMTPGTTVADATASARRETPSFGQRLAYLFTGIAGKRATASA